MNYTIFVQFIEFPHFNGISLKNFEIGAFDDPDVTHIEGEVDPVRDLDIISEELRLKDEENLDKTLEKMDRTVVRANDKKMKPEYVRLS